MDMLVSTAWLADILGTVTVLDATKHLPSAGRDAAAEFAEGHIPGARFLDLATLNDDASPIVAALPTAEQFALRLAALGVKPGSRVVLYDDSAPRTAARAWFIFRMFGWQDVAVLDGRLARWRTEGRPLEAGQSRPVPVAPGTYTADLRRTRDKAAVHANIDTAAEQVVDARDAGRFTGETVDTVHNLPGGHIPGARNLDFRIVLNEDGSLRREDELRAAFAEAGIDLARPVVTSCGSGVTASVLLFAMALLGKEEDTALYDGSWSEWGADPTAPREMGPAR